MERENDSQASQLLDVIVVFGVAFISFYPKALKYILPIASDCSLVQVGFPCVLITDCLEQR